MFVDFCLNHQTNCWFFCKRLLVLFYTGKIQNLDAHYHTHSLTVKSLILIENGKKQQLEFILMEQNSEEKTKKQTCFHHFTSFFFYDFVCLHLKAILFLILLKKNTFLPFFFLLFFFIIQFLYYNIICNQKIQYSIFKYKFRSQCYRKKPCCCFISW